MPGGSPRQFDRKEILNKLIELMAEGTRGAKQICREEKGFPTYAMLMMWVAQDAELFALYTQAQQLWCWAQKEIIHEIADDDSKDILESEYETRSGAVITKQTSDNTPVNRAKLRVSTRQWAMERLLAKHFAPQSKTEITGKDGEQIQINVRVHGKEDSGS